MELKELIVDEFTTPNPLKVAVGTSLSQAWDTMFSNKIRHILVHKENDIVGIVSSRDLTTFSQASNFEELKVEDIMSKDIYTVSPETKLYEVALKMSKEKIGSAVIYDPTEKSLGIFTATDALNALVEVLRGDIEKD
jgi:acetoin utilization protein AcuB